MKREDPISRRIGATVEFLTAFGVGGYFIADGSPLIGTVIILAGVVLTVYLLMTSE